MDHIINSNKGGRGREWDKHKLVVNYDPINIINGSCFLGLDDAGAGAKTSGAASWWSKLGMVAVVTGANKGIGFALVKRLAEMGLTVVLTARDEKRGREAVESIKKQLLLQQQGVRVGAASAAASAASASASASASADINNINIINNVHFFCLDVCDPASIAAFASWFSSTHGHLDILVNNAAVCFNDIHQNSLHNAHTVIATNFHGPKLLIEALLPTCMFRRPKSTCRILNITSRLGSLNKLKDANLRAAMADVQNLSEDKIMGMLDLFLSDVQQQQQQQLRGGWPEVWTDYSVSKLALNAYSKLLATRFKLQDLSVNCFCPGFTQTSMTRGGIIKGTLHTPDHAAAIAAALVLLPPHQLPTGIFFLAPAHAHAAGTTTTTAGTTTSPTRRGCQLTILSSL